MTIHCQEPTVLPSKVPTILVNGSSGIAVGMATNIPPHNLTEVINGLIALVDDPNMTVHRLMEIITGPDFPTGAFICGRAGIREAYETGRGVVIMRSRTHIEAEKEWWQNQSLSPRSLISRTRQRWLKR